MNKVTVVGAGKYGSMTALRIAEYDIVQEVVMTDIVEGLPQGLALDINQSRFVETCNDHYLVQLIKQPILPIPNFNFPKVVLAFLDVFWP